MSIKDEFKTLVETLTDKFSPPAVADLFFPPFHRGGQPKAAQFMALRLEDGSVGISYVLLPDDLEEAYSGMQASDYIGRDPRGLAREFGCDDPIKEMMALAAINAACQHVMRESKCELDHATDSLGLLNIREGDRVGMVGLFKGLVKTVQNANAELVIIEKNDRLIEKNAHLPITSDASALSACNKILCTGTTVLNGSLDSILSHSSSDAFVVVLGPTVGYFPDPLFDRNVDVVGGRIVKDGALFFQRLEKKERWGDATEKVCYRKETYKGML